MLQHEGTFGTSKKTFWVCWSWPKRIIIDFQLSSLESVQKKNVHSHYCWVKPRYNKLWTINTSNMIVELQTCKISLNMKTDKSEYVSTFYFWTDFKRSLENFSTCWRCLMNSILKYTVNPHLSSIFFGRKILAMIQKIQIACIS